jgi:DNA-binding NarL/FixJ family response regulator
VDYDGCRNAELQLAEARRNITTAMREIHRSAEVRPDPVPALCPHCGRSLDGAEPGPDQPTVAGALTSREQEVLMLLAAGLSNRHIARRLGIAEKTVKNHVAAVFSKLGVHDRTHAALYAIRSGQAWDHEAPCP